MSAMEEYRDSMLGPNAFCHKRLVDAAIAELEAEVQHQVERREEEKLRAVNAEAERDALRDRRCEGCEQFIPPNNCYEGVSAYWGDDGEETGITPDFACNRWQPREGGGG